MQNRASLLAHLLVLENGKPLREAHGEVAAAINAFEFFAGLARDINGRTVRDISVDVFAMTIREPAGVAGIIVPWNFPLAILAQKLPAALAAGCAAVIKPSPLTPLSSIATAQILLEAGLEPSAIAVLLGEGPSGAQLVRHPDTDVISFTGSTPTARQIAASAGQVRLKRLALEAGGKTPVIVMGDADLESAVDGILFSSFFNQGQVCVAGSRILVDQTVAEEFAERLAQKSKSIRLGDPFDPGTEMGPLISQQHFAGVIAAIESARDGGASTLVGGAGTEVTETNATPFLVPTVMWCTIDNNPAVQEEIFGPVTVVQPFKDLEAVIARANNSRFGLAASVWTKNISDAMELSLRLRTGTVWINGSTDAFPEIPLGGRRDSGFGAEFGREGLEFFTDLKTVQIRRGSTAPWYSP
jgi:betaine-aldehyde dehydrogenase